jgi:hypothetical protein
MLQEVEGGIRRAQPPSRPIHQSFLLQVGIVPGEGRRSQVMGIVRRSPQPLDDDQIAAALQMNRVYVNMICRQLAAEGLIVRDHGADGKLVNVPAVASQGTSSAPMTSNAPVQWRRRPTAERRAERVEDLIGSFAACVTAFETSEAFPGPSLYFHLRAIERRRRHQTVTSLLADTQFLEYAYAVLPAWGMHRMGTQAAKVGDFTAIVTALRQMQPALQELWPLRITALGPEAARQAAVTAWDVIARIKVSTSRTQIVAGSKMLHHVLPDLIPPIDRQYTFSFFTGQMSVPSDHAAFLDWFPQLAAIGTRCRQPIYDAMQRGGFMATGEAKVIDNAIMGYMQQQRLNGKRSSNPD